MISCLLITILGALFVHLFYPKSEFLEKICLGFLWGFGLITIPLYVLTEFNIRLNSGIAVYLLISLFSIAIIGLLIKNKFRRANFKSLLGALKKARPKLRTLTSLMVMLIVFIVLASFIINLYWPVNSWDAITLYDFRGRLFAQGGLLRDLSTHTHNLSYYFSYPPLLSLMHAVIYLFRESPAVLYSFFYASLLGLFYIHLKKETTIDTALLFTLVLAYNSIMFIHSTLSYTNLPHTVFFTIAVLYFWRFLKTDELKSYLIGVSLLAISVLIRSSEPFYMVPLVLLLIYYAAKRNLKYTIYVILSLLILQGIKYTWTFHVHNEMMIYSPLQKTNPTSLLKIPLLFFDLKKAKEVIDFLIISLKPHYWYLSLFILSLVIDIRHFKKNAYVALTVLVSLLMLYPGSVLLSVIYKDWNKIPDSLTRLVIFIIPLILFYAGSLPLFANVVKRFSALRVKLS